MFFALARRVALGAVPLVLSASACSESAAPSPTASSGSDAGMSVAFDVDGVLTTTPRQSVEIGLHSAVDTDISIRLDGDYAGASLSAGVVTTTGGHAKVTLHAPAVPATFSIRAHASGGPDARLDVSVSASGFATLHVTPRYAGKRPVPVLTGSVFVTSTCADLAAALASGHLQDGAPATDGTLAGPLTIPSVPAGSRVAVSLRVKLYAAGCVDLDPLAADSVRDIDVPILDRPMALGAIDLASNFAFEPDTTQLAAWTRMLDAATARAAEAFVARGTNEAAALLEAMRALVPTASQAQFDAARASGTWDSRASTWLAQRAPTMRERAVGWMAAGKADALGTLAVAITPGQSAGYAAFGLQSFNGFDANAVGMSAHAPVTFTSDADDVLHMSGTMHLWGSALVCTAADARAKQAIAGSTDVASALASIVDCAGLASSLVGSGTSYPSCNASCTASLCRAALAAMWKNGHDASATAGDDATIDLTASAQATIADDASPAQFSGAWVAQIASTKASFAGFGIKGSATGATRLVPH